MKKNREIRLVTIWNTVSFAMDLFHYFFSITTNVYLIIFDIIIQRPGYDVTELKPFVAPHADKTSFPDLLASQSKVRIFRLPPITTAGGKFVPALCRGLQLPYPSYPIVQHLKGTYQLRPLQVNVFGMPSRKETLTLTIDRPTSSEKIIFPESDDITTHSSQSAAPKLLNTVVHSKFPFELVLFLDICSCKSLFQPLQMYVSLPLSLLFLFFVL